MNLCDTVFDIVYNGSYMARRKDKEKAIQLRLKGMSYSQIKKELGLSKSTLSGWLADHPLSPERIRELRDLNPRRIENFRNTMRKKKEVRLAGVYKIVKKDIGELSKREIFLAGLFLYWGEGYKTAYTTTAIANTDPAMLRFFIKWLKVINIPIDKVNVRIHIYSDMDGKESVGYWRTQLKLPKDCFSPVYIKKSKLAGLSYKNGFGKGTCNVLVYNRDLNEYVLEALRYFREGEVSQI